MKFLITIFLIITSLTSQAQITGTWNMGKDNTILQITQTNGVFVGEIKSSDHDKIKAGTPLLKDIKLDDGEYIGLIYSLKKKKWLSVTLTPNGEILKARVKAGPIKKTLEWKKAE